MRFGKPGYMMDERFARSYSVVGISRTDYVKFNTNLLTLFGI